jgi:hypothetical protein
MQYNTIKNTHDEEANSADLKKTILEEAKNKIMRSSDNILTYLT